jgi:hypothetical protein
MIPMIFQNPMVLRKSKCNAPSGTTQGCFGPIAQKTNFAMFVDLMY